MGFFGLVPSGIEGYSDLTLLSGTELLGVNVVSISMGFERIVTTDVASSLRLFYPRCVTSIGIAIVALDLCRNNVV